MNRRALRPGLAAAAVLLASAAAVTMRGGLAQPRNGNEANGLSYQPTQGAVTAREKGAGVAPAPDRQRATTNELETLNRQLQNAENNDPQVHPGGRGAVNPNR